MSAVYVAQLDTGGISYSGTEYAAIGPDEKTACERVALAVALAYGQQDGGNTWQDGVQLWAMLHSEDDVPASIAAFAERLNEYYGIPVLNFPSDTTVLRDGEPTTTL